MKVTNLDQVKPLLALAVGLNPIISPFLVTDVTAGPEHDSKGKAQPYITIQAHPAFFQLKVDKLHDIIKPGSLIIVDLNDGVITHVGEAENTPLNQALIAEGSAGDAAKSTQVQGKGKQTGRTCSHRPINEL